MLLNDFLSALHREVRERIDHQVALSDGKTPFPELEFTMIFAGWMAERGITHQPMCCPYFATIDNKIVRLSGYALAEELDQLDLFVSIYRGAEEPGLLMEEDAIEAAEQCGRFLEFSASGALGKIVDETHDAFAFISTVAGAWQTMPHVRIHVLTDRCVGTLNIPAMDILGRSVPVEVVDIKKVFDQRQDSELH